MNSRYRYIVVEGNIGAGKTSLVSRIARDFNAKIVLEQFADNPFLPKFYADRERYSFTLELSFLAARYKQLYTELTDTDLFKAFTIADYYFAKSLIFAQSTLETDEYNLYRQLYNIIYKQLPKPDLYIYLHTEVEQLLAQIKLRGRDYEQNIPAEYLLEIQSSYFSFFKTVTDFPVVVVNCNEVDFVNNDEHYQQMLELIFNQTYENGLTRIES